MRKTASSLAVVMLGFALLRAGVCSGQSLKQQRFITPEKLGLPAGNRRTSEPGDRAFKVKDGKLTNPRTVQPGYIKKANEVVRWHYGVDISTQGKDGKAQFMDYKAGINGTVVRAGGGDYNTITVQLKDGTKIQYLHSSKVYVKVGQKVNPDTLIGKSGQTSPKDSPVGIHVHVQARDKADNPLKNPDQAFHKGEQPRSGGNAGSTGQDRKDLGGVLINPVPEKEDGPPGRSDAADALRRRPDAKAQGWRFKLPNGDKDRD